MLYFTLAFPIPPFHLHYKKNTEDLFKFHNFAYIIVNFSPFNFTQKIKMAKVIFKKDSWLKFSLPNLLFP